jgi:hypothetical protein
MNYSALSSHGYLLVAGLVPIGIGLLIISLIVNARVVHSVRKDERHQEKLFEYYRNTLSQLGVILIGIGVSLFIFFSSRAIRTSTTGMPNCGRSSPRWRSGSAAAPRSWNPSPNSIPSSMMAVPT